VAEDQTVVAAVFVPLERVRAAGLVAAALVFHERIKGQRLVGAPSASQSEPGWDQVELAPCQWKDAVAGPAAEQFPLLLDGDPQGSAQLARPQRPKVAHLAVCQQGGFKLSELLGHACILFRADCVASNLRAIVKGGVEVRRVADQSRGTPALSAPPDTGCQRAPIHFFGASSDPDSSGSACPVSGGWEPRRWSWRLDSRSR